MKEMQSQIVLLRRGVLNVATRRTGIFKEPDDTEPTPERQAELQRAYEMNMADSKHPYEGVWIFTRGELTWVMKERGWLETIEKGDIPSPDLRGANLSYANLPDVYLETAELSGATLQYADLRHSAMTDANLSGANLHGADLRGANLSGATLRGVDLRETRMDAATCLTDAALDSHTCLVDVVWNGVPVTGLNWKQIPRLGDETQARDHTWNGRESIVMWRYRDAQEATKRPAQRNLTKDDERKELERIESLVAHEDAVLANRQVASTLRSQGMNELADHFAYRAQMLQRHVLRLQRRYVRALGSTILDASSGYGYRPLRSFLTYGLVVAGFAVIYWVMRDSVHPSMNPLDSIIFSITSFHGRGFMPGENVNLHNPLTIAAAIEAVIGLLIEIIFIATFTQRFFAR